MIAVFVQRESKSGAQTAVNIEESVLDDSADRW
jgi:hypothetical protein